MRCLTLFILIFAWVSACAPSSKKHRKRHQNAYSYDQQAKKQKRNTKSSKLKSALQDRNSILLGSIKSSLLPTILNERDQTLMIRINAGKDYLGKTTFSIRGTLDENNSNSEFTNLAAFYIDRTEITVAQFRKYQPKYDEKPFTDGKDCPSCPAMGINWIHASKYCHWAGKRLPLEEEWEAAARGITKFPYPWGEIFQTSRANLFGKNDGHLFSAPVGSFQSGASASGVMDMAGNVWEWVNTKKHERPRTNLRVVKGGGWTSDKEQAKVSFRNHVDLKMKNPTFGFRCAKSQTE
ncbi:MAG: SUMF1/EgtB/PvdO family nonheme iron enzyme [Nitrospinaceae bacterium]